MSKTITIENFLQMNPQVPQFSLRNTNYLIAGANPISYLDDGTQEEQLAPLAASIDWKQITGTIEGNIVHMVASTEGTHSIYVITDTTHVYGITPTFAIVDLGYPSGGSINYTAGRLGCAGGYLFAYSPNVIYKNTLPATIGGWSTASSSINSSTGGQHLIEPFLDFVAFSDTDTSGQPFRLVRHLDVTSFSVTAGIDLGLGFGVLGMVNYNDKYLAIAVGRTSGSGVFGYPQNYLFLWDGISSHRYQYSMKIPGRYIDMKVIDSILYVTVQTTVGKTYLYRLSNTILKRVFEPQVSTITTGPWAPVPCSLFNFRGYVGLLLSTISSPSLVNPVIVYGQDDVGKFEFIHSSGKIFDQFVVGYDGNLFSNIYNNGSNSTIWYLPNTLPTSGTYQTMNYKSQWIPVRNLSAIDIYHDAKPTGTDAINVTIYGQGEDIISGNSTTVLSPITATTALTEKRTRLDVKGFTGDQVMIQLSTTNTTVRPIIRKIVLIMV